MEVLSLGVLRSVYSNPVTSTCLALIATACIYSGWNYWKLLRAYKNWPSSQIGIKWTLKVISGNYPKDVHLSSVFFQEILWQCRRFKKEGFCVIWLFRPYLFVFNKQFFKRLSNEPAAADKTSEYALIDFYGNGILTSNGEKWKHDRKLLNPAFSTGALKGKISIFNKHAADTVEKMEEVVGKSTTDLLSYMKFYSFNIFSESILGLKMSDEKYRLKLENYFKTIDVLAYSIVNRVACPWLYSKMSLPLFSEGRKYLKLTAEAQSFAQEVLLEMKNSVVADEGPQENLDSDVENKKSFARILLDQHLKDPSFTLKDVQDHVITMMTAGYDTTSYTLMWILYLLGHYPEVQAKAFSEIEALEGGDIAYGDLPELKYLECVIKESLRYLPTIPIYGRRLSKDIECGNYVIPKGTSVIFCLYLLFKDPDTYPDPEKFDPDRFRENSDIRPWMYMPFGEGYRNCIGKRFAMMEMKILLVHILRRFEIKTLDKLEETDLDWIVVMRTTKPTRMLLTLRQPQTPGK